MFSSLKKNGLSSTMHELKSQKYAKSASRAQRKEQSQVNQNQTKASGISKFDMGASELKSSQKLVLDAMIDIVSFKQHEACLIDSHDYNPTKYLCLQESCQRKIGCSYCFLENHKLHPKIEAKVCLKDLLQLKTKVKESRIQMVEHLQQKREEIYQKMKKQVAQIKQNFLNSLDFLSSKIGEEIERQFAQKLKRLTSFNISQKSKNISQSHNITFQRQSFQQGVKSNNQQLSFNQIAQLFNSKISVNNCSMAGLSRGTQKIRPKESRNVTDSFIFSLSKDETANLLARLGKLNLTYVEEYLRNELLQAKEFAEYLKVFQRFYLELGSSLDEFLATFKRAVPNCKSFENTMTEPDVLKLICL